MIPRELVLAMPRSSGVYALWQEDVCQYIGSSENMQVRVLHHAHRSKTNRVTWKEVALADLVTAEKAWIEELHPALNKAKTISRRTYRDRHAWKWSTRVRKWLRISAYSAGLWQTYGYCVAVERFNPALHHKNDSGSFLIRRKRALSAPQEAS